uniref:RFX-type winged-helix domain-containing protein n=1 Tax=Trichobilharzia regenti TaxID=157069 RepID=A0AA85J3N2_TRIRE|nr:unnamed protein product [Trichobilharzia regenti]
MQSASGPGATIVHVPPKSHTILQQGSQHVLLGKLESSNNRPPTSGVETSLLQAVHSNNSQTIYPAHYIEAIAEQMVYAGNGEGGGILEIKSGTPLRKLFASVTKSVSGQYQEYTPIIYAPVSSGQTYYQTANGQVLATAFGSTVTAGQAGSSLHAAAAHTNLGAGHAQLVTHHGATYLVQGAQLDDDPSAISHTAKASPVTVQWLVDNYETAEGVSLPRSTLYFHYLHHCNEHKLEPMNPASFGKLIRSVFYGLRTRRLGTRGNSKYHYYGIRIKPNSPLNHFVEDAGFSLRHYPNYHRQTMEAAAEWKYFNNTTNNSNTSNSTGGGNSTLNRLKSLNTTGNGINSSNNSSSTGGSGLGSTIIGLNNSNNNSANLHSTSLTTNNYSQLSSSHHTPGLLRPDKCLTNNSYTTGNNNNSSIGGNAISISGNQKIESIATNSLSSPLLPSAGQHHAQFLGEASSALPNLDEICRSSGLPVPSEVDLTNTTSDSPSGKGGGSRLKNESSLSSSSSSSSTSSFNEDVVTFCRLYALSAGYMLDAVVNLDFTAIETVWKAFWCTEEVRDSRLKQSLSQERLYSLVSDPAILQFVRLYDHTFYQSLAEVLIPNVLRPIPPTLTQAIRNFAKSLEGWMRQATLGLDSALVGLKVSAVSALAQTLRRYTSLNHLAQAARAVLKNANQINQMLTDLNRVDFNNVQEQASWVCQCSDATVSQLEHDFKRILQKHASLEEWAQWLDTVVTSILQPLEGNSLAYTKAAHQLVLKWSFYSSMVIRDLTLRSASSFGSFHLIRLLYDEYIFYLVEHKVAAHLGMTPVAVMGEMGRDITQQHCAQTRLHLDLPIRSDTVRSSKSNNINTNHNNIIINDTNNSSSVKLSNSLDSSQHHNDIDGSHRDASNSSKEGNISTTNNNSTSTDQQDRVDGALDDIDDDNNDNNNNNNNSNTNNNNLNTSPDIDDFDEEVDEYLDDEEEVDDSFGDESAMLKQAHASAQAYCRRSTTTTTTTSGNIIFQSTNSIADNTTNEIIIDGSQKDTAEEETQGTKNKDTVGGDIKKDGGGDNDDGNSNSNNNNNNNSGTIRSDKTSSLLTGNQVNIPNHHHSEKEKTTTIRNCSPPSIVTMPTPVRKVVRVTTFCDSRQQSNDSSFKNSTPLTTTVTTRPITLKQSSPSSLSGCGLTLLSSNSNIVNLSENSLPNDPTSSSSTSFNVTTIPTSIGTAKVTVTAAAATSNNDTSYAKRQKLL